METLADRMVAQIILHRLLNRQRSTRHRWCASVWIRTSIVPCTTSCRLHLATTAETWCEPLLRPNWGRHCFSTRATTKPWDLPQFLFDLLEMRQPVYRVMLCFRRNSINGTCTLVIAMARLLPVLSPVWVSQIFGKTMTTGPPTGIRPYRDKYLQHRCHTKHDTLTVSKKSNKRTIPLPLQELNDSCLVPVW